MLKLTPITKWTLFRGGEEDHAGKSKVRTQLLLQKKHCFMYLTKVPEIWSQVLITTT